MTTTQAYIDFKSKLETIYDDRESDNIADWVFEKVTGLKRWQRRNNHDKLIADYLIKLEKYLSALLQHQPVQYVLNEAWFYKMKFFVNENVLIPRPETEELVEWIVDDFRIQIGDLGFKEKLNFRIIDIGTGSGCIPVSLKKNLSNAEVTAIDVSEKALVVAKKNAHDLGTEINFQQLDFLNENEWENLPVLDIIVSNPPYIPIKEKAILAKNVTEFEPGIALFVANDDPYIFYEKIAAFSKVHLKQEGIIYVEVHEEYAGNVKTIFENAGLSATIKKDIYGKERMVRAIKKVI